MAGRSERAWAEGIRWIEAAEAQCSRYEERVHRNELALLHSLARALEQLDWDNPVHIPGPALTATVRDSWQEAADRSFLLLAVRSVLKAQIYLPPRRRPAIASEEPGFMDALRAAADHFDTLGARAERNPIERAHEQRRADILEAIAALHGPEELRSAAEEIRDEPPAPLAFTADAWVAGLEVSRIRRWLAETRQSFEDSLADARRWAIDPAEPLVVGDDEIRLDTPSPEDFEGRIRDAAEALIPALDRLLEAQ